MSVFRDCTFVMLAAAALYLLSPAVEAQEGERMEPPITVRPKPVGITPRMADGHPDFTGVWNGMGDNLGGVPNQLHNAGIAVENDHSTYDVLNSTKIATWPLPKPKHQNGEQDERAATLFRRMGANRPIYKPEYWEMVKELDANANEEDPSNTLRPCCPNRFLAAREIWLTLSPKSITNPFFVRESV